MRGELSCILCYLSGAESMGKESADGFGLWHMVIPTQHSRICSYFPSKSLPSYHDKMYNLKDKKRSIKDSGQGNESYLKRLNNVKLSY